MDLTHAFFVSGPGLAGPVLAGTHHPVLGPKAARQFVRATQSPSNWLTDTIIKPRLFCPDWLGAVYYPVDLDKFSEGRNHRLAKLIATDPDPPWRPTGAIPGRV